MERHARNKLSLPENYKTRVRERRSYNINNKINLIGFKTLHYYQIYQFSCTLVFNVVTICLSGRPIAIRKVGWYCWVNEAGSHYAHLRGKRGKKHETSRLSQDKIYVFLSTGHRGIQPQCHSYLIETKEAEFPHDRQSADL